MGCLIILAGLFGPRIGTVLLWLFTDRMERAFDNGIVPVLGFFFLPWTTFLYGLFLGGGGAIGSFGIVVIIIGLVADALSLGAGARERSRRAAA